MKKACQLNNLSEKEIKIINTGVSDKKSKYLVTDKGTVNKITLNENTGGWQWIENKNGLDFTTLDELWDKKIIGEIGFFWLDAQWMEDKILIGGKKYLNHNKPLILMEYCPITKYDTDNKSIMKWKIGTSEEIKKDVKFQKIFKDIGIKIYDEQPS